MKPFVVSYTTTTDYEGLRLFRDSLNQHRWSHNFLLADWRGWGYRLRLVLSQAESLRRAGFTHLINLDAFDVLAQGPPSELEAALSPYKDAALVLAGEKGCWPDTTLASHAKYQAVESEWRYAHSQFVYNLSKPLPFRPEAIIDTVDDQDFLARQYLGCTDGSIVVDSECRVVQSIAHCNPWQDFFEFDERVKNKVTGTTPIFAHGNGGTDMFWLGGLKK